MPWLLAAAAVHAISFVLARCSVERMQAGAASDVNRQAVGEQRYRPRDVPPRAQARGRPRREPADLVVRGGRVLSVFTREWLDADVAVVDGMIAGVGRYDGGRRSTPPAASSCPGFIDAHMHIESVKLLVDELARLVLPFGTTAVVADPHEIANVLGVDGVHWLIDASAGLQLEVFFMAPSCVPASPFESPRAAARARRPRGADAAPADARAGRDDELPRRRRRRSGELAKLALEGAAHVDGHAPGLRGKELQAYAAAGIASDHEALTVEEGRERLRAGMWLLIREASMARNLQALLPLVLEYGPGRIAFCTDDRDPEDIADGGHINGMVRDAVAAGVVAGGRAADGVAPPGSMAPARVTTARSRPGTSPTCCSSPTWSDSCRTSCSSAASRSGRFPRRTLPTGCGRPSASSPSRRRDFAIPWQAGPVARDRPGRRTRS